MASEKNTDEGSGLLSSLPAVKGYKWVSVVLVMAFLAVGGFVAWFIMKNAAHKLVGGDKYAQLSANSASYGAGARAEQEPGFFVSEEELAKADPKLRKELLAASGGSPAGSGAASTSMTGSGGGAAGGGGSAGDEDISGGSGGSGTGAAAHGAALEGKLGARAGGGAAQSKGGAASKPSDFRQEGGASVASIKSMQSDTGKPGGQGSGPKTSVLSALRNAFKANLYGARLASNDAARGWVAKTFDANADSRYSLEYDEKMKAKLDRINPDSIPKYLKEQSLDAESAKSLGASEVEKPDFDKDGTKDALKGDKKYQAEKDSKDLAKALFNPLGPFGSSGGGSTDPGGQDTDPADTGRGPKVTGVDGGAGIYNDPEATQTLNDIAIEDYVATEGFGAECGCTAEAPCCCLPPQPDTGNQTCPMYGPFLPNDPCGAAIYGPTGDFPPIDPNAPIAV